MRLGHSASPIAITSLAVAEAMIVESLLVWKVLLVIRIYQGDKTHNIRTREANSRRGDLRCPAPVVSDAEGHERT